MTSDTPGIDLDAAERLRQQGGYELLGSLIESFLARTPVRIEQAQSFVEAGDVHRAGEVMHLLGSSCAMLGAVAMQSSCRSGEGHALQDRSDGVAHAVASLRAEFQRIRPHFERLLVEARR